MQQALRLQWGLGSGSIVGDKQETSNWQWLVLYSGPQGILLSPHACIWEAMGFVRRPVCPLQSMIVKGDNNIGLKK